MTKSVCKICDSLIHNWYSEYEFLGYCSEYPFVVHRMDSNYYIEIRCSKCPDFCSSVLVEKVVQIANAACVSYHISYENGLVFILH